MVLGPNLPDQTKGDFHVHAEGCRDIARYPRSIRDGGTLLDVNSVEEISAVIYDFEENPEQYAHDFYDFPCVKFEEKKETVLVKTVKITFEVYISDVWIEFEVETSAPDTVMRNLIRDTPARNVKVY
jgi:hypothetical protein